MQNFIWNPPPGHCPFEGSTVIANDIQAFVVDGNKIEKVPAAQNEPKAVYYRTHFEGKDLVLVHLRIPASNTWIWRPITLMDDWEFMGLVEDIVSYENGTYQRDTEMSNALLMMLLNLQKGNKPQTD